MTARLSGRIRYVVQIDVNYAYTDNIRYIYVILEVRSFLFTMIHLSRGHHQDNILTERLM
jgi:hypothetical protein